MYTSCIRHTVIHPKCWYSEASNEKLNNGKQKQEPTVMGRRGEANSALFMVMNIRTAPVLLIITIL